MIGSDFKLLDLYCGAGGSSKGYERAGFKPENIVGVDIVPQPHYPYRFIQMDALDFAVQFGDQFDAIHASPPCKFATPLKHLHNKRIYRNYIPDTQFLLRSLGKPYIIENVIGARKYLRKSILLCGTMFGLGTDDAELWRHRLFECYPFCVPALFCRHGNKRVISVVGHSGGKSNRRDAKGFKAQKRNAAMEIGWMTQQELSQAVPPAFTGYLGKHLIQFLKDPAALSDWRFLEHPYTLPVAL